MRQGSSWRVDVLRGHDETTTALDGRKLSTTERARMEEDNGIEEGGGEVRGDGRRCRGGMTVVWRRSPSSTNIKTLTLLYLTKESICR